MSTVNKSAATTPEVKEVLEELIKWHKGQVDGIDKILDHPNATIDLGGELEIKPGTDMSKGFRAGLILARSYLGTLPITLGPIEVEVDEEEEK